MIRDEGEARAWLSTRVASSTLAKLERLADLLSAENERQNLVSAASLGAMWRRHIADSAQLLELVPRGTSPWLDLGSGAGFPGLVIAICQPEIRVTLVESRRRRIEWLEFAASTLAIDNVDIAGSRLEDVPTAPFSVISARAFAPLARLIDLSARFSTAETHWLLPKGRSARQELDMLSRWRHSLAVRASLTDGDAGIIVGHVLGRKGKTA